MPDDVSLESRREGPFVAEATLADADPFAEFLLGAWKEAGPDAPGFAGATEEAIAEITAQGAFRQRIGGPNRRMFLAWERDRVVGFCATKRVTADSVELAGVVVTQSRAGLGIGTALIEHAMSRAFEDGYREVIVKTETTNERAAAFYRARGFASTGVETERVDDVSVEVLRLSRRI